MNDSVIITRRLGDILELQRGYDLPTSKRIDGEVPIISSSGYSGYHNEYKCEGENVVTGRYGTIGEVYYYSGKCWPLNTALFVKDFKGNIPKYVYYLLKNALSVYRVSGNDKSAVPGVDRKVIHEMLVPFHEDISYQKNICDVLTCIDDKIKTNNQICLSLEAMAKTLYDYWFVQFDFPDKNGKPYRTSGGEMVWNEQLKREIPEGWSVQSLSHGISGIRTGLNPRDNFVLGNGDIQYLTVKNLTTSGTIDFSGCDTVDESARNIIHARSDISIGDILFASIAPLGRCYLIQREPQKWDINESIFSIRANADIFTAEFLYMYFMSDTFIKGATSSSTGSIFKGIRINTLLDIITIFPPQNIMDIFSKQAQKILALKEQIAIENQELTKLRDWLLPMLMNGQARVE